MREIASEISGSHAVVLRRARFGGSRPARMRLCSAPESDFPIERPPCGAWLTSAPNRPRRWTGAERPRSTCPLAAASPLRRPYAGRRTPEGAAPVRLLPGCSAQYSRAASPVTYLSGYLRHLYRGIAVRYGAFCRGSFVIRSNRDEMRAISAPAFAVPGQWDAAQHLSAPRPSKMRRTLYITLSLMALRLMLRPKPTSPDLLVRLRKAGF